MPGPKPRFTVEMLEALPPGLSIPEQASRLGCGEARVSVLRQQSAAHRATLGSKGRPVKYRPSDLDGLMHLTVQQQMKILGASKGAIMRIRQERDDYVRYSRASSVRRAQDPSQLDGLLDKTQREQAVILGFSESTVRSIRDMHPHYVEETARLHFIQRVRKAYPDMDAIVRIAQQHATKKEN